MSKKADRMLQSIEEDDARAQERREKLLKEINKDHLKGFVPPETKKYYGQKEEVSRIKRKRRSQTK